jgi:DNA-binding MarR family transcriptional regulator
MKTQSLNQNQENVISVIVSAVDHKLNTIDVAKNIYLPVVATHSILQSLNKRGLINKHSNQFARHITWSLNEINNAIDC